MNAYVNELPGGCQGTRTNSHADVRWNGGVILTDGILKTLLSGIYFDICNTY